MGFWQLDRHSQKSDINERISARLEYEPLGLVDIDKLKSYEITEMERDFEYRSIAVSGKYIQEDSVLIRNRTYNGVQVLVIDSFPTLKQPNNCCQ